LKLDLATAEDMSKVNTPEERRFNKRLEHLDLLINDLVGLNDALIGSTNNRTTYGLFDAATPFDLHSGIQRTGIDALDNFKHFFHVLATLRHDTAQILDDAMNDRLNLSTLETARMYIEVNEIRDVVTEFLEIVRARYPEQSPPNITWPDSFMPDEQENMRAFVSDNYVVKDAGHLEYELLQTVDYISKNLDLPCEHARFTDIIKQILDEVSETRHDTEGVTRMLEETRLSDAANGGGNGGWGCGDAYHTGEPAVDMQIRDEMDIDSRMYF